MCWHTCCVCPLTFAHAGFVARPKKGLRGASAGAASGDRPASSGQSSDSDHTSSDHTSTSRDTDNSDHSASSDHGHASSSDHATDSSSNSSSCIDSDSSSSPTSNSDKDPDFRIRPSKLARAFGHALPSVQQRRAPTAAARRGRKPTATSAQAAAVPVRMGPRVGKAAKSTPPQTQAPQAAQGAPPGPVPPVKPLPPPGAYYEYAGQRVLVPEWPSTMTHSDQYISTTLSLIIRQALADGRAMGLAALCDGGRTLTEWGKELMLRVKAKAHALETFDAMLYGEVSPLFTRVLAPVAACT